MNIKPFLSFVFVYHFLNFSVAAQSSANTLDIVSWNVEWFGSTNNGPTNKNVQQENVIKILRYLNADIYGLVEIVDTARLRKVVDSLGSNNYGFVVSDYCSLAGSPIDADWLPGQKLAYIYNKNVVKNIKVRRYMGNSGTAYSNFASGRFPFYMNCDVTINNTTKNINIFLLHGKAGTTNSDYTRRKDAAAELKDSIDFQFPNRLNFIIGDFNDDLDATISTGSGPASSYEVIVKDSIDENHYKSITLPLSKTNQASMISYADPVDHHIISNKAAELYVSGSASFRKDIISVVPDFTSGNTSDHYPVFSSYLLNQVATAITILPSFGKQLQILGNPVRDAILVKMHKDQKHTSFKVFDVMGRLITYQTFKYIHSGEIIKIPLQQTSGLYWLEVSNANFRSTYSIQKK